MLDVHLYESKHKDGDVIREHHHLQHQFLYALDGKGKITLDGRTFDFEPNTAAVIVPHSNHAIVSDSRLTVLVLAFDETVLEGSIRSGLLHSQFSRSMLVTLNVIGDNELRTLLRKMLFEQSRAEPLNRLAIRIYLMQLLLVVIRNKQTFHTPLVNHLRAERLRNYLDTHYFELVNSESMAAKLGVSARHINNIFKETYRMTPLQYLTELRMGLAQKMLAETDKDISSICFEIGYESLSTFYRTFKIYRRMSPNQYRKLHSAADAGLAAELV
jgi:AraC-like DNA-binding protein